MKKFFLTSLILVGLSAVCFGTYTTTSSEYKTPILKTALNFQATYANGKVTTSWANINVVTSKAMKWYKVVKSTSNNNPVYPDDGYITAISDRGQTNFVETSPSNGTYYYRVCAIMEDMNRYCSNVVTLTINKTETTTTSTTTTTTLTASLKTMIENLTTAFMAKLDTKYSTDIEAKISFLDTLTTKIGSLVKGKNAALFAYLKEKLEEQADLLRVQALLDI